jgi:radical SAM superfamily enzyme YgiQ (UPF0313 family)
MDRPADAAGFHRGLLRSPVVHRGPPATSTIGSQKGEAMNIVLGDIHSSVLNRDQTSANLSLLYLASYLRARMPEVTFNYISQKHLPERHWSAVKEYNASIYAASFTSFSASDTYAITRRMKELYPGVLIVIGGPHVITHSEEALRRSRADICVIGEGEVTFHEIAQRRDELPGALPRIQGIAYLDRDTYKRTESRPLIVDLDTIPIPRRDLVTQADFIGLTYSKARPNTEMVVTRGCPLRCVFCANPVYRLQNGPLFRARSPENIAEEAEQLYALGYREIYIHSDELNVDLKWSIDVCRALAALNHTDLYYQCNMRAVPMSEELAFWMKQANFWLVRMGVESSSDRVLRGIKKRMSVDKTEYACEVLSKQGIKVLAYLMMFNFWEEDGRLQCETADEVRNTIRFVYRLWRQRKLAYSSWTFPTPIPGAEMYDIARKHRFIDEDFTPSFTWKIEEHLPIDKNEFNALYARARRQTALMALASGHFEWRNWKEISRKALTMLRGKPDDPEHVRSPEVRGAH